MMPFKKPAPNQRGASLIMVMLILVIVSILGAAAAQIALMSERGARNDRDLQLATQAAEAALLDAEDDIDSPASSRSASFAEGSAIDFVPGCGTSGNQRGLCTEVLSGQPVWLTTDLNDTARTVGFGDFTARTFAAGSQGVQPEQKPRYIVELITSTSGSAVGEEKGLSHTNLGKTKGVLYRVTAIGYGPRTEVRAVMQMIFRKVKK